MIFLLKVNDFEVQKAEKSKLYFARPSNYYVISSFGSQGDDNVSHFVDNFTTILVMNF